MARPNQKGRSKRQPPYVKLEWYMVQGQAWRALAPSAIAVYVQLSLRFRPSRNGRIGMSVREAARLSNLSEKTAGKALKQLQELGFIKCRIKGAFSWKEGKASEWELTAFPLSEGRAATKEFMHWKPDAEKPKKNAEVKSTGGGGKSYTSANDSKVELNEKRYERE